MIPRKLLLCLCNHKTPLEALTMTVVVVDAYHKQQNIFSSLLAQSVGYTRIVIYAGC